MPTQAVLTAKTGNAICQCKQCYKVTQEVIQPNAGRATSWHRQCYRPRQAVLSVNARIGRSRLVQSYQPTQAVLPAQICRWGYLLTPAVLSAKARSACYQPKQAVLPSLTTQDNLICKIEVNCPSLCSSISWPWPWFSYVGVCIGVAPPPPPLCTEVTQVYDLSKTCYYTSTYSMSLYIYSIVNSSWNSTQQDCNGFIVLGHALWAQKRNSNINLS